ncbi:MAG: hypothetical protein LQ337_006086 [Flavoplaca oasis]|nr:MAG: hypothetical protein LQ337_006086 [Flavoplaca oasis]
MQWTSLLLASGLAQLAFAAYSVKDDYSTDKFLDMFNFDTFDDPTHGYVNYVDQATADSQDLYNVSNGQVTWGVDHRNIASGRGRNSIRLTSKAQYTHGLVMLDVAHMPGGACGVWPAFWMTGPNWPNNGEIDIIEGVNNQVQNQMTLHTGPGCALAGSSCEGGPGCAIKPEGSNNYGTDLNNAGGGVYAMEWTSGSINIWFFPRNSIPSDVSGPNPNPSTWGAATASFVGGESCNIDQHFKNNHIVFTTTFCGDWAGGVWSQDGTCSAQAGTCQEYVQNHPEAYADAYWTINSLKVYQDNGNVPEVVEKNVVPDISSIVPSIAAPTQIANVESSFSAPVATPVMEPSSTKSEGVYTATTTVGGGQKYNFYGRSKAASKVYTATTTVGVRKHNYNFYAPTKVVRSVATDMPVVQQSHQERAFADEGEMTNDTTAAASRDVEDGKAPVLQDSLGGEAGESKPEGMGGQKVSRHLHRHVHHLRRS